MNADQTRGQALLELAIFGSFLVMVLAVLLNYGLSAEYNQQVTMESFRQALSLAPAPGSASYTILREEHIPNPTNPFVIGLVRPFIASARVTKDFRMHETADTVEELPELTLDIDGTVRKFKTAGFVGGALGGELDPCEGEILDVDQCKARCLKDSSPWYCSKLDQLFAGIPRMGLQDDRVADRLVDASIAKTESDSDIATTTALDWEETVSIGVVSRPLGDQSGNVKTETITATPKDQDTSTTWATPW